MRKTIDSIKWKKTLVSHVDTDKPQGLTEQFIISAAPIRTEKEDDGKYGGWGGVGINFFNDTYDVAHDTTFDTDPTVMDLQNIAIH